MSCCSAIQDKTCPSRMNDGRSFTDYRPKCVYNSDYMSDLYKNDITASSYESRLFLQNNAEKIMEQQRKAAMDKLLCGVSCYKNNEQGTMHPERYVVHCDQVSCNRKEVNPQGLGDGRKY